MSNAGFYSRKRQFFREWRVLWRMHWLDTLLGGLYVLIGFYAFRRVGLSQVYDVFAPFVVASIDAAYLAFVISIPQSGGNTLPYYFNLPRNRTAAWDAHLAYLVCTALWMEAVILVGVLFKLGGAGITPHYRLHPEVIVLPFLAIAAAFSFAHLRHTVRNRVSSALILLMFTFGLLYWLGFSVRETAEQDNNFFPPRGLPLSVQCVLASLLLVYAMFVLAVTRRHWKRREVGEIK